MNRKISLVVLTHNRVRELERSLERAFALPEAPPVIVVDNASRDDTPQMVRARFPRAKLVRLPENVGAAARNVGADRAETPYIAFCDDDQYWEPGALERAAQLFDFYPRLGGVTARVRVGEDERDDPVSAEMAASPLPSQGLPGRKVLGFLAGSTAFRLEAFHAAGGFEPRFFVGGEETLLAYDMAAAGWSIAYVPELAVRHFPSPVRDSSGRRRVQARNALWVAWLRRPIPAALRETARITRASFPDRDAFAGCLEALQGMPWALSRRKVLPQEVETLCRQLEQ